MPTAWATSTERGRLAAPRAQAKSKSTSRPLNAWTPYTEVRGRKEESDSLADGAGDGRALPAEHQTDSLSSVSNPVGGRDPQLQGGSPAAEHRPKEGGPSLKGPEARRPQTKRLDFSKYFYCV